MKFRTHLTFREYREKYCERLKLRYFYQLKIPKLSGNTAILVAAKWFYGKCYIEHSTVSYIDIATLMGAISNYISDNSLVIGFASHAKVVNLDKDAGILENMDKIQNCQLDMRHTLKKRWNC